MSSQNFIEFSYGSFCVRHSNWHHGFWSCYESSDYHYLAVVDDFGNLVGVSSYRNLRGY